MKNIIFLSLVIFALFILCISVGISFAQQPATSDSFSNMSFSNMSFSSTLPVNTLSTLSNNSTTFPLLPPQSTTSSLNNNQTFGNPNNFLSNNSSFSSTLPVNTLSPLSNNSATFPLLPPQSTTSPLNNNQTFGNPNNFLSNQSIANVQPNFPSIVSSQNINNFSTLPSLYNLTANSVVAVTSFDATNHSILKTGTGFIYSYKGAPSILTVSNLFTGNNDITVTLSDGSSYDSVVDGYDPLTTIAVLSTKNIPQIKLVPLKLTNSSTLKVGQVVSAIGNTMGFSNLLSTGIISGLGKFIPTFGQNISGSDVKIPNGITTNLNLGYGYGGSPLFDNEGRVVGMNIGNYSSPAAGQSKNNGISFAIPSNLISKIVPSLLEKGYYAHPWFGAGGTDVDLDIAKALNLTESRGFLVIDVTPSSPAKKAGILGGDNVTDIKGRKITLGGDIILKVDNKNVQNIQELSGYIENNKNIGDDMLVTLLRNGIIQLINVRLDANPNYLLPLK